MTIDPQSLNDVIIALVTTIGIAVALSLAMFAVGALAERREARTARVAITADQASDPRDLALR
jgi:hypothetical protein